MFTYLTRKSLCEIRYRDDTGRWRLSWLTNPVSSDLEAAQARLFRADAGLTALKRLYEGLLVYPFSGSPFFLTDTVRHEQPDCLEGCFPPGTGMNVRCGARSFPPPSLVMACRKLHPFPVIILFFLLF